MAWHRGQAYSQDIRDRVLRAGGSIREVAERFEVSESYVAHARGRRHRLGADTPGEQRCHVPPRLAAIEKELAAKVDENNDQQLKDLVDWAYKWHGVHTSITAMWGTLRRLGLRLKNDASRQRASTSRRSGQASPWVEQQAELPVGRLFFVDETWATTNMTPTRGKAPRGRRCIGRVPQGRWHTTTFLCALRYNGLTALLVIDGSAGTDARGASIAFMSIRLFPHRVGTGRRCVPILSCHKCHSRCLYSRVES